MAATQHERRPTFFWQGLMIVLPVAALAVASLVSLHQDERAVEDDARHRATEDVQSLARAMHVSVDEELQRFLTLQNMWMLGLHSASQGSVSMVFPDTKLQADIEKWELDYPGLRFVEQVLPQGEILADGRRIEPPDCPDVPRPPKWFRELSPKQAQLWDALRTTGGQNELTTFLNSNPSSEAREAASCLTRPASEIAARSTALPSETGISFEEIACGQLLSASHAQLTDMLLQSVWWRVIDHPSMISPKLLELAGELTNSAGPAPQQKYFWLQQLWREQLKLRDYLDWLHYHSRSGGSQSGPWADWAHSVLDPEKVSASGWEIGTALLFFAPCTFNNMGSDGDELPLSGRGYEVWCVRRQVVDAIFDRALKENRVFIPDYASATVSVAENQFESVYDRGLANSKVFIIPSTFISTNRGILKGIPTDELPGALGWQLLGTAAQTIDVPMIAGATGFDVNLYLVRHGEMLSAERGRARLFGALILGAALTALAGLVSARRAFRRQLQLNEEKSNFVSSVSHELRAPIASVRLMAENLERGKVSEPGKQGEYFRFIVQECRRLSSLIENVLDAARIEQGRKQYEFEPTNLVALVETTVKLMEPYAAEKGVVLRQATFNIQHSTLNTQGGASSNMPSLGTGHAMELNIDGRAIQQALVNLIDNAVKHSPKGEVVMVGIESRAGVSPAPRALQREQSGLQEPPQDARWTGETPVLLYVADHGPGIPAAEHEKIFERFYRLGPELRRQTQGVGIGLSVVKHIVEAHGGRVRVESEAGKGSRFVIELPIGK